MKMKRISLTIICVLLLMLGACSERETAAIAAAYQWLDSDIRESILAPESVAQVRTFHAESPFMAFGEDGIADIGGRDLTEVAFAVDRGTGNKNTVFVWLDPETGRVLGGDDSQWPWENNIGIRLFVEDINAGEEPEITLYLRSYDTPGEDNIRLGTAVTLEIYGKEGRVLFSHELTERLEIAYGECLAVEPPRFSPMLAVRPEGFTLTEGNYRAFITFEYTWIGNYFTGPAFYKKYVDFKVHG